MADQSTAPPRRAGIPTTHRGIEYRSRLEARWAAFFHNIGWEHTYEPFDGHGYIPDFLIHGKRPLLVEVKPAVTAGEYDAPMDKIEAGLADFTHDVLIVGATPFPSMISNSWAPAAGLLGEWYGFGEPDLPVNHARTYARGEWILCRNCHSVAVRHEYQSFMGRPCGCYDGDHYCGEPPMGYLHKAWADACNDMKWRGR